MDLPRLQRLRGQLYRLEGSACRACGARFYPPRSTCRECGGHELALLALSGRGRLYSFAQVPALPDGFAGVAPGAFGLVQLEEGVIVFAQLTDTPAAALRIGAPCRLVIRKSKAHGKRGPIVYAFKFVVEPPEPARGAA
jgi:uncharacterized OB-fold protein